MSSDIFLENMGLRIAQRRKELHWTQEQLAEKMGVSLQTVSNIELGKKAVRPKNLANLCMYMDVSADYILYGKRNEKQLSNTVLKLSALDSEAYTMVENLIDLLYRR
nr:helix-turn-helix transcriptional regulator [Oscillospiraceae bacterium]